MDWLNLLILSLATWRLAYFLVKESAPFNLMGRFREAHPNWGVFQCVYCASVWTAALMYILWQTPLAPLVTIFAITGGALMLATYTGVNRG